MTLSWHDTAKLTLAGIVTGISIMAVYGLVWVMFIFPNYCT